MNLNACSEGVEFARRFDTYQEAWNACQRGDFMLWLAGKLSGEIGSDARKQLVLAACACARLALPFVKKGENSPRLAIETAEAYVRGEATLEAVRSAYSSAYAYAYTYAAASASACAYASAHAAAYVCASASYAADASHYASAAARKKMQAECADEVRRIIPVAPKLKEGA